jgi:hypothetical protein
VRRGEPNYDQMVPEVAKMTWAQLILDQAILATLGTVQTVTFARVGDAEDYVYKVKFDNGSAEWRIVLTRDGKIR